MLNSVEWGEFRIGELFKVRKGKRLPERVLIETKGNIALINQSTQNNMVARYSGLQESNEIYKKNSITFGVNTKGFGYQTNDFYTIADVLFLKSAFLNKKNANYFITSIKKQLPPDGWDKIFGLSQMKDLFIQLPVENGKINFSFMENFIAELEAEHLAELEAYLVATGLKNYTLTDKEQKVLEDFENGKFEWNDYRIEDVLQWQSQKEIDPLKLEQLKDESEMEYPFYGQATINNGIISYHQLTKKVLNNENGKPTILIHSNNQNIVYLETPFYLKDGHGATSVLQSEKLNKINQMFIIASIDKVIKSKYSYNNKATKIELKNTIINLPIENKKPNYTLMETFISAIQKLIIKDIVLYSEQKISTTKSIVEKEI